MNKYRAVRTYSSLCGRFFPSKAECTRGEELKILEMVGEISGLEYQPKFILCKQPKISYTADFAYSVQGKLMIEDSKGVLTRETRVKIAWVLEKFGVEILLTR